LLVSKVYLTVSTTKQFREFVAVCGRIWPKISNYSESITKIYLKNYAKWSVSEYIQDKIWKILGAI